MRDYPAFRDEIAAAVNVTHFEVGFGVIAGITPSPMFRVECTGLLNDTDVSVIYLVLPDDDAVRLFINVCERYLEKRNDEVLKTENL